MGETRIRDERRPVDHHGARQACAESLAPVIPPVMGSVLDFHEGDRQLLRVYITGETLVHDRLGDIRRPFPAIDLCLLHLGGTRIPDVLLTMDASQGVELL